MFDDQKRTSIGREGRLGRDTAGDTKKPKLQLANWDLLSTEELLEVYAQVELRLPPLELSKMNLEKELLLQFHTLRSLQTRSMDDDDTPLNQRAQVGNSVSSALNKLTELQKDIYTTERFKMLEGMMIRALSKLPEDVAAEFLAQYKKMVGKDA